MRFRTRFLASVAAASIVACSDPYGISPATVENVIDTTVTLGALHFTDVSIPSGFSVSGFPFMVHTDESTDFDFVYDIDPVLGPMLVPGQLTGVYAASPANPGLQRTTMPFDSIKIAPSNGYKVDQNFAVDSGDVFLVRGSTFHCNSGLPTYAKLEVLSIDTTAKTVTFKSLRDRNCAYRGLETGIPRH